MLACDVDGVAADFTFASYLAHGLEPVAPDRWDYFKGWEPALSGREFWQPIYALGDRFYDEMVPPFEWTQELWEAVREADDEVILYSDVSSHPTSYASKVRWLEKYFPGIPLHTGKNKQVLARHDVMLIDDNNENTENFVKAGGNAILFPQPWNKNAKLATPNRINYVKRALEEWREYGQCSLVVR